MIELLGFLAGALVAIAFLPQVWRLLKLRSAREISLPFTLLLILGVSLWLTYGILSNLPPVTLWNAVMLALIIPMLYAKLRYGE
ncbi:hypothetical protein KKF82_06930 [Patescibacteria group bacterium]|nr:hypothetical protein [Patescibacteria group bacterium]